MKKIEVKIPGSSYPVYIGNGVFLQLQKLISKHALYKNIFIIIDENVFNLHSDKIDRFISKSNSKIYLYSINATELNKSSSQLSDIYSVLIENGFGKDSLIVAIGGGITGDIAGYAASTFARGVQIVHVPTTLLAMVDSSVGGKTGINFESTKNIIGTFYQPNFVLIDLDFLKTLPEEEVLCGLGEILKYSFLIGGDFLEQINKKYMKILSLDTKFLLDVVENCISFKTGIVEKDEREESGLRKILNLGHTFAHAIEIERNHSIKHGQAVITGLSCALHLSNRLNILNDTLYKEYLSMLLRTKNQIQLGLFYPMKIYEIMKRDKKSANDKIRFVLIKEAGNVVIDIEAGMVDVMDSINSGLHHFVATEHK
ncbi:MAG: 3-dehydroquinate synthase [Melioribacteraceae bacterium]|nr:3-dehydroquinate synthase [Melioribacteraceae bacterium]